MRERQRQTATKPRYYIRGIEITTHSGLGRFGAGGGLARDFEHHHHVVHLGLGRASWHGTQGLPPPFRRPLWPSSRVGFAPIPTKSGASRASGWDLWKSGAAATRASTSRSEPVTPTSQGLWSTSDLIVGAASRSWARTPPTNTYRVLVPRASTELDKIFDQALILWCGMVTCGRAEIPVLGRDMGALGFKFPTTHRAYGGAGSELRRAEGGMVRSSEGTQRRSFSSLG